MYTRLAIGIGVCAVVAAFFVSVAHAPTIIPERGSVTATLTIDDILPSTSVSVAEGATALSLLKDVGKEIQIDIRLKGYAGLGTLVDGIASSTNGDDNKYWQYRVNEQFVQVGADSYVVQNGDTIRWSFEIPQEF